jgi:hypothetical protein
MGGGRETKGFGGVANGGLVIALDVVLGRGAMRLRRFFVDICAIRHAIGLGMGVWSNTMVRSPLFTLPRRRGWRRSR